MTRVRISTTVDKELLTRARAAHGGGTDASLIEAALTELLHRRRRAEVDAAYAEAYRDHPLDGPDDWGDLDSWHRAVAEARGITAHRKRGCSGRTGLGASLRG